MSKKIIIGEAARESLLAGANIMADAVASTLGPAGRGAVLHRQRGFTPLVTRDGVTVAKEIDLPDLLQDAGAQMVRGAAERTVEDAGDGTTTSTVLARAIFREGLEALKSGVNPVEIKRGLDHYAELIVAYLDKVSKPVRGDMIQHVATISTNNDPVLGKLVADALRSVGTSGVVTVEDSQTFETSFTSVEGMQFNSGYISPYFVTDQGRQECVLNEPYILIANVKLSVMKPKMLELFSVLAKSGKDFIVIADDIEGPCMATLVVNKSQWNTCGVRVPVWGPYKKDMLMDMATLTGATVVMEDLGLSDQSIEIKHLGRAKKIIVTKHSTTILQGGGSEAQITQRVSDLRTQITTATNEYERDNLQERLAKLVGGVSIIKVGASSRIELGEKKARVEDAMHATRCAIEEGIVAGGGTALVAALYSLPHSNEPAFRILEVALTEPLRNIAENAGLNGEEVLKNVLTKGEGFNALTLKYENLIQAGVIDPTKVVKAAVRNAVSVAGMMISMKTLIVNDEEAEAKRKSTLPGAR